MKNLPQAGAEKGAADDIAAKQVGLSRPTAVKGAQVVQAIDRLIAEGKQDEAEELRAVLNGQSFDAAIQAAMKAGHIEQPPPKKPSTTNNPSVGNKQDSKAKTDRHSSNKEDASVHKDGGGTGSASSRTTGEPQGTPDSSAAGENTGDAESVGANSAASGLTPLVVLTNAINQFVADGNAFDSDNTPNDQKWNFNRAFKALSEWYDHHAEHLKQPGQSSL